MRNGFFACLSIREHAREFWDLREPAPIFFLFHFNGKAHIMAALHEKEHRFMFCDLYLQCAHCTSQWGKCLTPVYESAASSALASWRSAVSNPSVNHP